jgi:gliding motility-associated-like protein/uncharacterized repeat protein (TIGR01451 family)
MCVFNLTYFEKFKRGLVVILCLISANSFAQSSDVFTCDAAALYQTIKIPNDVANVGSRGDMIFYQVEPNTGVFTFVSNLSVDDDGAANGDVALSTNKINSIGFNPVDGFIYGIEPDQDILYRISPNGFLENLGIITGELPNANGNVAGVFDNNGIFYIYGGSGRLISLDLSNSPSAGDPFVSELLYDTNRPSSDIAINPVNGLVYGWDQRNNRRQLFTIDPTNGDINVIGPANGTSPFKVFGALYFTAGGQLIGYGDDTTVGASNNSQESLVQIDLNTGVPSLIATGLSVGTNDGASCPYGFELFKDAPDNVELGSVFTYTFTISNATATPLQGLEFVDNLMSGLVFVSEPYNITNGISVVGATDGLTSANLIINDVPTGPSSFQIDVVTDCSVDNMTIMNQASLTSDFLSVISDDPESSGITNTTITGVETPTITVPQPLDIEGCNIQIISTENAVFPLNTDTISGDIKDVFNTIDGYSTSAPQNIVSITYIDSIVEDSSCPIVINREFTLTNTCNNVSTLIQVINIQDLTAPSFTVPADVTINCSEDPSNFSLTGDVTDENDNCSENLQASFTDVINTDGFPDTCNSAYTILRTWRLVDDCNNVLEQVQNITIEDTTAPTITACSLTNEIVECAGSAGNEDLANNWNAANISALQNCATDDCNTDFTGLVTSDYDFNNFNINCGQSGFITVTYNVSDGCGNNVSLEPVTLTINDTIAPVLENCGVENTVIDCTAYDNENLANAWNAANIASLEACSADGCDTDLTGQVTSDYDYANLNSTCGECGTLNVTYTVTDDCGNSSDLSVTLTFDDGNLPDLTNCSVIDQTVECSFNDIESIANNWNTSNISSLENCSQTFDITVTSDYDFNNLEIACGQTGDINVAYTLTDLCGNATVFEATFTIEDNSAPVFDDVTDDVCVAEFENSSFEANTFDGTFIQFQQEDVPGWSTTASHNTIEIQRSGQIDGSIPFDGNYHFELNGKALDDLYQEFCTIPLSNLEVSFYHKKRRANATGVDVLELFIGSDLNNLTSQGLFEVSDADGWKQNIVSYVVPAGQNATVVLFQAISGTTNSIGNLLDAITVNSDDNNNGPLPEDITVECNDIPEVPELTASDNCGTANVTLVESIEAGSCSNQYTIVRTWTATDDCGNSTSHTQNITVQDTTDPGFTTTPPSNVTVECGNIPNAPTLIADDNCGSAEVTFEEVTTAGDCLSIETIVRTWTATDECGNTNIHEQIITVEDTSAPIAPEAPEDIVLQCTDSLPIPVDLVAIDDCSGEITASPVATVDDTDACNTITTYTWTFTDACNNSTQITQTITITDNLAPTFTVPADIELECDVDATDLTITGNITNQADNCSTDLEVNFVDTVANGDCVNTFITTRLWQVTDNCGNTTEKVQTITVQDTTAPALVSELEEVINVECVDIPEVPELIFEDNCSATNVTINFNETSTADGTVTDYVINREWRVIDECGNEGLYFQTINVSVGSEIDVDDENLCITEDFEFDLFNLLNGDYDPDGVWTVTSGNASIDGSFFNPSSLLDDNDGYTPDQIREYEFTYTYGGSCPGDATVIVNINDDCVVLPCGQDDLVISKAVTANFDGINEFFTITGTESCGFVYELQIFNRWGSKIYDNSNYQNDWNGTASSGSIGNSEFVPTGTYYYVLNIMNSGLEPVTGPIYVSTK